MKQYKVGDIISPNEEEIKQYPVTYKTHGKLWRIIRIDYTYSYYVIEALNSNFKTTIKFNRVADNQVNKVIAI